ncbi:MAG: dethiobiotin synthase [Candidatus Omnitrophota bacterium]
MKAIFVTGTGTGVGKTTVCRLLERFLKTNGYRTITQKWICTGSKTLPINKDKQPYTFKFPASPHLAARLERKCVSKKIIKQSFRNLQRQFDFVIVEGIGGALVPFNNKQLVIDIAKELKLPVLVVIDNKLGAINHALLTIEALRRRKMNIIGLIFNNRRKSQNKIILNDNVDIIKRLTGKRVLGVLPFIQRRALSHRWFGFCNAWC